MSDPIAHTRVPPLLGTAPEGLVATVATVVEAAAAEAGGTGVATWAAGCGVAAGAETGGAVGAGADGAAGAPHAARRVIPAAEAIQPSTARRRIRPRAVTACMLGPLLSDSMVRPLVGGLYASHGHVRLRRRHHSHLYGTKTTALSAARASST